MRDRAQLLITNPDMLHMSILPVHRTFSRLLANLRYVVVDEGHAYRCVQAGDVNFASRVSVPWLCCDLPVPAGVSPTKRL